MCRRWNSRVQRRIAHALVQAVRYRPRRMRSRPAILIFGALLAAAALAACGGSSSNGVASKSPNAIVTATTKAALTLKSVHVYGKVVNATSTVSLNLRIVAGKGATGSMDENGLAFQIVTNSKDTYLKAGPALWNRYSPAVSALLANKWLMAPNGSSQFASLFTSLSQFTDLTTFFSGVFASHGTLTKGKTSTIDGVSVIGVIDTTQGGTLWVATSGKPYPIEISSAGGAQTGGKSGSISFNDFNAPVSLTAPSGAINVAQLAQLAH